MPLNSVQLLVKSTLDGLQFPITEQGTLTAYIAPPNPDNIDGPIVHIWGGVSDEKRRTMTRPVGNKSISYEIDLWIYFAEELDDSLSDSLFPVILDTIALKLRTMTMPLTITDPNTGVSSNIVSIGEDMKTDYAPARTNTNQSFMIYMARMVLDIDEWVTG